MNDGGFEMARIRRSGLLAIAVALTLSPAIAEQETQPGGRVALVIGNANYQDDNASLSEPVNDARTMADELRRSGFEVELGEDLSRAATQEALSRLYGKIKPGSAVVFFFSGFGAQSNRQSYLIPVNAQIWTEADVRREGVS